jgi:hypothetical protein
MFPISVKYQFSDKRIIPFISAGLEYGYLMNSLGTEKKSYNGLTSYSQELPLISLDQSRNKSNLLVDCSLGLILFHRDNSLFLEAGYEQALFNIMDEKDRFNNVLLGFEYIESNFAFRDISVQIGITHRFSLH